MKLLFSAVALAYTVVADPNCGMQCFREFMRDEIKCDNMEGITEEEQIQCSNDAFKQFWSGCLGDTCGNNMPDGRCGELLFYFLLP